MADLVMQRQTTLSSDDVIARAVPFFSTAKWRATTQSTRSATFQGKPPIPWFMLLFTVIGLLACLVPGIILYVMVIRKMYQFQNLIVTATPTSGATDVVVQYPKPAESLVKRFLDALPALA